MSQYRYATKDLSINNAKAFVHAVSMVAGTDSDEDGRDTKRSTILYAVLGHSTEWASEPTPDIPDDNEQYLQYEVHRRFIAGKKITLGDISHVAPRYNWTSGTVYSQYRDTDIDMYERPFYVITDENNVYKCLFNNKGAASTIKPTGYSIQRFQTSDGYIWKYMYTVSLGLANKFLTTSHIPVRTLNATDGGSESDRQMAVQNAAVNGAIEIVETVTPGSGYHSIANTAVERGGRLSLQLSAVGDNPPSSIDNFYNGSSVYIIAGTGAGQLRRIIDYSGESKTLVVNTAFATTCNTDSVAIISPTVTIVGDGQGALAYTTLNESGGVSEITVINDGSAYTRAEAYITANSIHGSGATANVVISPVGGHGSDPIRELHADKVMLNVQFTGEEGTFGTGAGYLPSNTEFRSISILKDPIVKVNSNNEILTTEHIANTSNSPSVLRFATRLEIAYLDVEDGEPINPLEKDDVITNERNRLRAELGELEFVTELGSTARQENALRNSLRSANAQVIYTQSIGDGSTYMALINNVNSYSDYPAFTKDDVILKSTSETKVATVEAIAGPEANTYSGKVLMTENFQPVQRDPDQVEDIKIILDF